MSDGELTKHAARKSLGQHFLFDMNLTRKIARQTGDLDGECVIEVGPGPGGLTKALLETNLRHLILVEKDDRFAAEWAVHAQSDPRITVIHGDALQIDECAALASTSATSARIIANLPYNVGTPLLVKWLKAGAWRGPMALMFQLEVAERICAQAGDEAYGRLSVIAQSRATPRIALRVPASAFTPPPKVDSAVVVFNPLPPDSMFEDVAALEFVTAQAFGQRRKMLRQSLKAACAGRGLDAIALLERAGVDPESRPERLAPEAFHALAGVWRASAMDRASDAAPE